MVTIEISTINTSDRGPRPDAYLAPGAFTDFRAEVVALELERTFWEKATILHAEFHRPADRQMRDRHALSSAN